LSRSGLLDGSSLPIAKKQVDLVADTDSATNDDAAAFALCSMTAVDVLRLWQWRSCHNPDQGPNGQVVAKLIERHAGTCRFDPAA
jgi:hypothetical protein